MFLTRGDMPHEKAWSQWLYAAKWLIPPAYANLESGVSESSLPKHFWSQSSNAKTGRQHYLEQALFNVYVHSPPNHTGYAPQTVFRDRDINGRVQVATSPQEQAEQQLFTFCKALHVCSASECIKEACQAQRNTIIELREACS